MNSHQQLAEEIRRVVAGPRAADGDVELFAAYASACADIGHRLEVCQAYLRKGLRSEAVHLASEPPDLSTAVRALALVEWPEVAAACSRHGLRTPRQLQGVDADAIDSAVEVERQLEPWLARHRLLALGKAPVRERLDTLRELARRDPQNRSWRQALLDLEPARLRQLRGEAKASFAAGDVGALQRSADELAEAWVSPAAGQVRAEVQKAVSAASRRRSLKTLQAILVEAQDAYARKSFERCEPLINRWQAALRAEPDLELPVALQEGIRPVVQWLAAEERRREGFRKMQLVKENLQKDDVLLRRRLRLNRGVAALLFIAAAVGVGGLVYAYFRLAR